MGERYGRVPRLLDTLYLAKGSARGIEICKQEKDFFEIARRHLAAITIFGLNEWSNFNHFLIGR